MRYLLLFSICLSSVFSYGQSKKIAFKLGNEYELPKGAQDLAFAGNQKDGLVNLALKKDELTIVKFNPSTLDQTNASVIELPELTKNFNSEIVAEFGDKYFWIHSDWDKENQKELLYYDKVDVTTGKITSANNKMLESSKISGSRIGGSSMGFSFGGNKVVDKYDFNFDADHKKLMVSYRLIPDD
ncbi:MAG: hypothetical protein HY305_05865 [Sphingobacteriales bacterium]|nr:hypothetical protein [Sphingobacteriales bacterium]